MLPKILARLEVANSENRSVRAAGPDYMMLTAKAEEIDG